MSYERLRSILAAATALSAKIRTPRNYCLNPECLRLLDAATCVGSKAKPKPDDLSVCIYCGHIMAYDQKMKFRELTGKEIHAYAGNEAILRIQEARKSLADKTH